MPTLKAISQQQKVVTATDDKKKNQNNLMNRNNDNDDIHSIASSSIVSEAISSYSAYSYRSAASTYSGAGGSLLGFGGRSSSSATPSMRYNRGGAVHGGDLIIASLDPPPDKTIVQGSNHHTSPSSATQTINNGNSPPLVTIMMDENNNSSIEGVTNENTKTTMKARIAMIKHSASNDDLAFSDTGFNNNNNYRQKSISVPTGMFSPELTFGELRPLFALTRLRMLYEFHLRNVLTSSSSSSTNKKKMNNKNGMMREDENDDGNLKIRLNPIMDTILYSNDNQASPSSPSSSANPTSSPDVKVQNYKKTIKKKNILFDFEEEVLEDKNILRRRKIRNVAEWFLKISAVRRTQEKENEKKNNNTRAADGSSVNPAVGNPNNTGAKLFNEIHGRPSTPPGSKKEKREVCGHIVAFPALTQVLTKSAVQINSFGCRPLSGLAILALVCAEHGELEIAVAATRILPGNLREQIQQQRILLPDNNKNNNTPNNHEYFQSRADALLERHERETRIHDEFDTIQQLVYNRQKNNNNNSSKRGTPLNNNHVARRRSPLQAASFGKPKTHQGGVSFAAALNAVRDARLPKNDKDHNEAIKKEETTTHYSPQQQQQKQKSIDTGMPLHRQFQDTVNAIVNDHEEQMTNVEKKVLRDRDDYFNRGENGRRKRDPVNQDSFLTDEEEDRETEADALTQKKLISEEKRKQLEQERERKRLAAKFGYNIPTTNNSASSSNTPSSLLINKSDAQLEKLFEKFGRGVIEENQIPRTGFRDAINQERENIKDFLISPLCSTSDFQRENTPFVSDYIGNLLKNRVMSPVHERYLCICETMGIKPNRTLLFSSSSSSSSSLSSKSFAKCQSLEEVTELSFKNNLIGDRGILPLLELTRHHHDLVKGVCCCSFSKTTEDTTTPDDNDFFDVVDENKQLLKNHCTLTPNLNLIELPGNNISDLGCECIAEWLFNRFIISVKKKQNEKEKNNMNEGTHQPSSSSFPPFVDENLDNYKSCSRFYNTNIDSSSSSTLQTIHIDLSGNRDISFGGAMTLIRTLEKIRKICKKEEWWQNLEMISSIHKSMRLRMATSSALEHHSDQQSYAGLFYSPSSHQLLKEELNNQQDANLANLGNTGLMRTNTQINLAKARKMLEMTPSMRFDMRTRQALVQSNYAHQNTDRKIENSDALHRRDIRKQNDTNSSKNAADFDDNNDDHLVGLTKQETELFGLDAENHGSGFFTLEKKTSSSPSKRSALENNNNTNAKTTYERTQLPGAFVEVDDDNNHNNNNDNHDEDEMMFGEQVSSMTTASFIPNNNNMSNSPTGADVACVVSRRLKDSGFPSQQSFQTAVSQKSRQQEQSVSASASASAASLIAGAAQGEGFCLIQIDLSNCSVPAGLCRRLLDLGKI